MRQPSTHICECKCDCLGFHPGDYADASARWTIEPEPLALAILPSKVPTVCTDFAGATTIVESRRTDVLLAHRRSARLRASTSLTSGRN